MIYISVFLLFFSLVIMQERKFKLSPLLLLIPFVGLVVCRYNTGTDYWNYVNSFNSIVDGKAGEYEVIWQVIVSSLGLFSGVGILMILSLALFVLLFIAFLSYSRRVGIESAIFVILMYWPTFFMGTIRMSFASCIMVITYKYLRDEKYMKSFVYLVIAGLIHRGVYSVIPVIIVYLLYKYSIRKKSFLVLYLSLLFFVVIFLNRDVIFFIFGNSASLVIYKLVNYSNYDIVGLNVLSISKHLFVLVLMFFRNYKDRFEFYFLLLGYLFVDILNFSVLSHVVTRLGTPLLILEAFVLANIFRDFMKEKSVQKSCALLVVVFLIGFSKFYSMKNYYIPYYSILDTNEAMLIRD